MIKHGCSWILFLVICSFSQTAFGQTCARPNMLIVLDNSNSMRRDNKLADANAAIRAVVTQFTKSIRFGLMTFCGKQSDIRLVTPITDTSNPAVLSNLPTKTCYATPMRKTIDSVRDYLTLTLFPKDKTKRQTYVMFVTDGRSTDGSPVTGVKGLRSLRVGSTSYEVKTFVVGFGKGVNPTVLSQMAKEGGTQKYFQANNKSSLQSALSQIASAASAEICDNKDNDCDGKTDEDFANKGKPCSAGSGPCKDSGKFVCAKDGKSTVCDAVGRQPTKETCDGKDNDCDGKTDEDFPTLGTPCSAGAACKNSGKIQCKPDGSGVECSAKGGTPKREVCDGKDNDCNGKVDDLFRSCSSACGAGTQLCVNGSWAPCDAPAPAKEKCDGLDNDCDGVVDEDAQKNLCPGGSLCQDGRCLDPCRNGECARGFLCSKGYCSPSPCKPACSNGNVCVRGRCTKPTACDPACKTGEACVQGRCVADACAGKCSTTQACRAGVCVDTCVEGRCGAGQRCVQGKCLRDPCAGVQCKQDQVCDEGKCARDECEGTQCDAGKVCKGGTCVGDPCLQIRCPSGATCREGQCWRPAGENPPSEPSNPDGGLGPNDGDRSRPDGDGTPSLTDKGQGANGADDSNGGRRRAAGCACASHVPRDGLFWMLLLLAALRFQRRRRER